MPNIPALAPNHWLCDQCSEHADCNQGVCVCRSGWNGNGIECVYNCPDEYVWNIDRCIPIVSNSDDEESENIELILLFRNSKLEYQSKTTKIIIFLR